MTMLRRWIGGAVFGLSLYGAAAQAGPYNISFGVRFGYPGYYRPHYGCYWPRPIYVMPPPAVVVAPVPGVIAVPGPAPGTVFVPSYGSPAPAESSDAYGVPTLPPPRPLPSNAPPPDPTPPFNPPPPAPLPQSLPSAEVQQQPTQAVRPAHAVDNRPAFVNGCLRSLADRDERVRLEAVTQLGRLKAHRAVDPLAATLAGDPIPAVREAAAKALGLIGAPGALPALNRAAQVDVDHDVRRTARFAAEIIQAR